MNDAARGIAFGLLLSVPIWCCICLGIDSGIGCVMMPKSRHHPCSPRVGAATSTLKRPRNSDGDDRAASPGWGGTAPSKSLIGRHWLGIETTDHIDTRSRIGNKQRAITAVTHGACQRLSPDSEPRTG